MKDLKKLFKKVVHVVKAPGRLTGKAASHIIPKNHKKTR